MFKYGLDQLTSSIALKLARKEMIGGFALETVVRIHQAHEYVQTLSQGDDAVYGINTGFGPLCNTIISKEDTIELQRRILISHSVGVGEAIPKETVRLMLILKVHALAKGYSGISLEILERILWHVDQDILPVVPEQGSVGASGDLAPLAHLFLPLIGEGEVLTKGKIEPSGKVLALHGIEPVALGPKAGLALINGTQFIAAHAVQLVEKLYHALSQADIIAAMMIDGLLGSRMPFHPVLHQTRPFPGNQHVASRIFRFLDNSEIVSSHTDCDKVQDPYSLRCVPQVHGSSRSAWLHLKDAVEIEINSVTDNPVVFSGEMTISGGNFHGQPLALPLDYACLAAAEIGSISDRRSYLSLEGKAEGTPKLLMKETGVNSGFMILQYTGAALVSENKGLCFPASADSIPTSLGQEDHVSMGSIGARKALRVCNNLMNVLAIELLCAGQALDFKRPLKSGTVIENAHRILRDTVSFAEEDRQFSIDINKASTLLSSAALLEADEHSRNDLLSSTFDTY